MPLVLGSGNAMAWVWALVWLYIIGSAVLLLAVRQLRIYPLYLIKSAWISFTVLAFSWVVMMSGATNRAFALNPAGVYGEIGHYPDAARVIFHGNIWWLFWLAWPALWAAGGLLPVGSISRRSLRVALIILSALILAPLGVVAAKYDWSQYHNFQANYAYAWREARMGRYFVNSILISFCTVGLVSVLASMAAYALTRLHFRGRDLILAMFVGAMAIPGFLLVVPLFVMMKGWSVGNFSFMDSRFGLAVLYTATSLPFTIFVLSAFYRTLPHELAESAAIDGATPWQIFTIIFFPLAAPGLATTAIFNFLGVWNEYNFALIFLTNPDFKTLPVGLYNLQVAQQFANNWPALFAGVVILCLPTFLIFVVLQERIVAGITVGAVKG